MTALFYYFWMSLDTVDWYIDAGIVTYETDVNYGYSVLERAHCLKIFKLGF
jgi:hypothetical protein